MLVFTFVLVSLALTALFCMGNFVFWQAVLIFAGLFLAVNIVYILCAFSTSALVRDMEKPIEAEKPLCRFAAISVFGLVCSYVGANVTLRGEEKLPKDETSFWSATIAPPLTLLSSCAIFALIKSPALPSPLS